MELRGLRQHGRNGPVAAHRWLVAIAILLTGAAIDGGAATTASAAPEVPATTLCAGWTDHHAKAAVDAGRYVISPNTWNTDARLCVTNSGGSDFTVTDNAITVGAIREPARGPAAYPNISTLGIGGAPSVPISDLGDLTTAWSTTQPAAGTYNAAYDIWYNTDPADCSPETSTELMIWLSTRGKEPAGERLPDPVTISDAEYRVYAARLPGQRHLTSYLMTSPATSVRALNIRAFTRDAAMRGFVPPNAHLCAVQAGFEIWDGGAALNGLATRSFSVHPVVGRPVGQITSGIAGKCLDDLHSDVTDGNPVVIHTCNGTAAQAWTSHNDGTLRVLGKCLDVAGGGRIVIATCSGRSGQRWRPGPRHALVNVGANQCLDDPLSSVTDGTPVRLWACNGTAAQQWRMPYNGTPVAGALTSKVSGRCLDNLRSRVEDGNPVVIHTCNGTAAQDWTLGNDGTLQVMGRCLDVAGDEPVDHTPVQIAGCAGSDRQQWVIAPSGYLVHRRSGRCLEVPDGPAVDGTVLRIATCALVHRQVWYLPV